MPARLAALIREQASLEQHHKVKRRALQLMALAVVQPAPKVDAAEASNGLSTAGASSKALLLGQACAPTEKFVGQMETAGTASQEVGESTRCSVLGEVQALQQQLHDAQHPEVGSMPAEHCSRYGRVTQACLVTSKTSQRNSEQSMQCWLMLHPCSMRQQQDCLGSCAD